MIELEKYEILEEIGRGGMAIVYKAKHKLLHSHVAIKVLFPQFTHDEEFLKRFINGARSAAHLKHENIIPVYDVGDEDGNYYIVMECLEGEGLDERIKRQGKFSEDEIETIMRPLAGALDYAHKRGVIHRDIKSSNIFLAEGGRVVLMDFDIAKASDLTVNLTQDGTLLGTPAYMSPEQARGEKVEFTSDIYSFGVVLYEMATGRLPFTGESTFSVLHQIAMGNPSPPREINPVVSANLDKRILWCMEQLPGDRPGSVGEIFGAGTSGAGKKTAEKSDKKAEKKAAKEKAAEEKADKKKVATEEKEKKEAERQREIAEKKAAAEKKAIAEKEAIAEKKAAAEKKAEEEKAAGAGVGVSETHPGNLDTSGLSSRVDNLEKALQTADIPPAPEDQTTKDRTTEKSKRSKIRLRMPRSVKRVAWIIAIVITVVLIKENMFPENYNFGVKAIFSASENSGRLPSPPVASRNLSTGDKGKVRTLHRDALKKIDDGDIVKAAEKLAEIRGIDPGNALAHEGMQRIYDWHLAKAGNMLAGGNFTGYDNFMDRAVSYCPSMKMDNLCQRARVYQSSKRFFGRGDTNAAAVYFKILGAHAGTMMDWFSGRF
ncbi:MAG: serine/threonine protein kinase [Candidatus Krumholzibacteria bacterium]|nr:serine/threonine protein kinase [Candidatus Krumholzibacteria bacterium]